MWSRLVTGRMRLGANRTEFRVLSLATLAVATASVVAAVVASPASSGHAAKSMVLYVDPASGSDQAVGSTAAPLRTIQAALDRAKPGAVIHLAAGTYTEAPQTRVAGTASQPITIEGPEQGYAPAGRFKAILYTTGHGFSIENSHYVLRGFTIDGQQSLEATHPRSTWPHTLRGVTAFKDSVQGDVVDDRLVFVAAPTGGAPVTGTVIDDMNLVGAGGECVHIREASTHTLITHTVISYCGMHAKNYPGAFRYHNGEGVYIGTSPKSTTDPMHLDDATSYTRVVASRIRTYGSECFDVKENAFHNALVNSVCADNTEPLQYSGSNIELRGYDNSISGTTVRASLGDGVKIRSDSAQYDRGGNTIVGNTFRGQAGVAIANGSQVAQGLICGNTVVNGRAVAVRSWLAPCPASG